MEYLHLRDQMTQNEKITERLFSHKAGLVVYTTKNQLDYFGLSPAI